MLSLFLKKHSACFAGPRGHHPGRNNRAACSRCAPLAGSPGPAPWRRLKRRLCRSAYSAAHGFPRPLLRFACPISVWRSCNSSFLPERRQQRWPIHFPGKYDAKHLLSFFNSFFLKWCYIMQYTLSTNWSNDSWFLPHVESSMAFSLPPHRC
jgi:hypothetical protein